MEFQVVSLASSIHLRHLRLIPLRSILPSQLASFGERPPARGANGFGTEHVRTGIGFVRGNRFVAERVHFLDPSCRNRHWLRGSCPQDVGRCSGPVPAGGEGWAGIPLSASSQPRSGTRPGEGTAEADQQLGDMSRLRLVITVVGFVRGARAADAIGFVRGNGACGLAHVVDQYELSKSGAREARSFIIGERRERVREIR
jgi:hypothetical protein